jgi:hypothetical protein
MRANKCPRVPAVPTHSPFVEWPMFLLFCIVALALRRRCSATSSTPLCRPSSPTILRHHATLLGPPGPVSHGQLSARRDCHQRRQQGHRILRRVCSGIQSDCFRQAVRNGHTRSEWTPKDKMLADIARSVIPVHKSPVTSAPSVAGDSMTTAGAPCANCDGTATGDAVTGRNGTHAAEGGDAPEHDGEGDATAATEFGGCWGGAGRRSPHGPCLRAMVHAGHHHAWGGRQGHQAESPDRVRTQALRS